MVDHLRSSLSKNQIITPRFTISCAWTATLLGPVALIHVGVGFSLQCGSVSHQVFVPLKTLMIHLQSYTMIRDSRGLFVVGKDRQRFLWTHLH
jgi:hypothetical protein